MDVSKEGMSVVCRMTATKVKIKMYSQFLKAYLPLRILTSSILEKFT